MIERPAARPSRSLKTVADARVDPNSVDRISYLDSVPAGVALHALVGGKPWSTDRNGRLYLGDPNGTFICFGNPAETEPLTAEQRERDELKLLALDESLAQTFLFLMARDLAKSGTESAVHINELLSLKGYARNRKGDFKPPDKRKERDRFFLLSELFLVVDDTISTNAGRRARKTRIKSISPLIVVPGVNVSAPAKRDGEALTSLMDSKSVSYLFDVQLGSWAKAYRLNPTYSRTVLATLGKYDTARETQRVAARLMFQLMYSVVLGRKASIESWRVGELLHSIDLEQPSHHPDRFREAFESALDLLTRDHLLTGWHYTDSQATAMLPMRNWFSQWEALEVSLQFPRESVAVATRRKTAQAPDTTALTLDLG